MIPGVQRHKPDALDVAWGCVDPKLSAKMSQQFQLLCSTAIDWIVDCGVLQLILLSLVLNTMLPVQLSV